MSLLPSLSLQQALLAQVLLPLGERMEMALALVGVRLLRVARDQIGERAHVVLPDQTLIVLYVKVT
jgi:hypothetical protein